MSTIEQARYTVAASHGAIEIRDYAPMIVAEANVAGERKAAIQAGFRVIAGYIFGDNEAARKVAMTAPVTQQPGEKIAMTAPVTQQAANGLWTVRFVMPAQYTMQTLPKPNNPSVNLREVPGKRFVVIRFSGLASDKNLSEQTARLEKFIKAKNLTGISPPVYAFFNPPWTLPFLRRNEVMIEINAVT